MSLGNIDHRDNILNKEPWEFLASSKENEIEEYAKIASSILSEVAQAKEKGGSPPLDERTIKRVEENQLAITRIRNNYLSPHISDLSNKSTQELITDHSIREVDQYIDEATMLIDRSKKEKGYGDLHKKLYETSIEDLTTKRDELLKIRQPLTPRFFLAPTYKLEETAIALSKSWAEELSQLSEIQLKKPEHQAIANQKRHQIFEAYEKAAMDYERQGDLQDAWRVRAMAARAIDIPASHPLFNMTDKIEAQKKKNLDPYTGARISQLDTNMMREGTASFDKRVIEDLPIQAPESMIPLAPKRIPTLCASFDMNLPSRDALNARIDHIEKNPQIFQKQLPKGFCTDITIKKDVPYLYRQIQPDGSFSTAKGSNGAKDNTALEIEFHGVGKIIIGNNPKYGCHYTRVTIECPDKGGIDQGMNLKKMEQMLTLLGLPSALAEKTQEDNERSKLISLFHALHPKEAEKLEQLETYYTMPLSDLKALILQKIPQHKKENFLRRLDKMELREGLPGQLTWTVPDLVEDLYKNGLWYLMVGMGGTGHDDRSFQRGMESGVKFLLSTGFLSSADRFRSGYTSALGASSVADLASGGGNGVFTRAINNQLSLRSITALPFSGGVQAIIDPKSLIDCDTLYYLNDSYGVDNPESRLYKSYKKRPTPKKFARSLRLLNNANEIVIRGTIPPKAVSSLVVQKAKHRQALIDYLKKEGFAKNESGKFMINGKDVEDFVIVSNKFTRSMR